MFGIKPRGVHEAVYVPPTEPMPDVWAGDGLEWADLLTAILFSCERHHPQAGHPEADCTCHVLRRDPRRLAVFLWARRTAAEHGYLRELDELKGVTR